jgi:hypothetical protein
LQEKLDDQQVLSHEKLSGTVGRVAIELFQQGIEQGQQQDRGEKGKAK